MKAKTLSSFILLLAVAACQQLASTARATVTFSVTPSAVSNFYAGPITLQVSGLNTGETVQIDKFVDVNGNGVIDSADFPAQSFLLTDGQASVMSGVTNINVPGDANSTNGVITAQLRIASDITQRLVAQYLFRLSSPTNHFTALTNLFNVTNSAYAQSFTGTVRNNGTNVPNAVIMVQPGTGKKGNPFAGVLANSSGNYTLNLPGGTYGFWLFKSNYVANLSKAPLLTLTNGTTFTTNLNFLIPATNSISGYLVDAANTNIGLPGIFMVCETPDNQFMAGACYSGTNGAFTVPVIAGQWKVSMASEGLAAYGYLDLNNNPQVDTTTGSVSRVLLALPKATALFYGTLLDSQSHPLAGIDISCQDNNNQYQADAYTDANGYFVAAVAGGLSNDSWQAQISSDSAPANYIFSQPSFNQNGGTNLSAGQAVLANFTAVLATNQISGWLKDPSGNPISGVGIWANATINGVDYNQNSMSTDGNGNYSVSVASGAWTLGVSTCNNCSDGLPSNYFAPANQSVVISNNNGTANFTALSATNHISGSLKDNNGNPIAGVGIWASAMINGVNYNLGVSGTDANGNYSLNVMNGSWTLSVSSGGDSNPLPSNYLCPANQTVLITNNNGTANFTTILATHNISGHIQQNNGNPIGGVAVWASATINNVDYSQFVDADGNGNYSLNVANGNWSVSLSCNGGSDSLDNILGNGNYQCPGNQNTLISNGNGTADFIVVLTTSYTNAISGTLKDNNGSPISGVGVWASATIDGVPYNQGNVYTDANGDYSLNVPNGTWTVGVINGGGSGQLPNNYLIPPSQTVEIASNNGTAIFIAILATNHITGTIKDNSGNPIIGVGVTANTMFNGVYYYQSCQTNSTPGGYTMNVPIGSWSVGLSIGGGTGALPTTYLFPASQTVVITNNNGTANFIVLVANHTISGHVQDSNGNPISGLGLWASTSMNGTNYYQVANTDPSGNYVLNVVNASWSVSLDDVGSTGSLDAIFGSGNYVDPGNQTVPINNNNGTANFTVQVQAPPAADVVSYYVTKLEAFLQVGPTSLVPNTNFGPFNAYLGLVQADLDAVPLASVMLPTGAEVALPWGNTGIQLQNQQSFPNQAAIDAAYPPGNYTFGLYAMGDGLQYPVLSMPSAAYPNPPQVSNFAAAQAINPLSPFTLQWNSIPGATTNDYLWVFATDSGGNTVISTPNPSANAAAALNGTTTSFVIPTNTFQPGHAYTGWITVFHTTSVNTNEYPGATGVTLVAAATSFPLALASSAPRPRLDLATKLSGTQFNFQLSGTVGQNYTVQVSTNLASTNWSTLLVTNLSASPVFIQDNQASSKQRFYRVKVGP